MLCPNCQNKIHNETPACPYCGAVISAQQREQAAQAEKDGHQGWEDIGDESSLSLASGKDLPYVVIQVTLKEKLIGTGSGNLTELEEAINRQAAKGYRLHTITTSNGGSKGLMGGDRIQATMVFEKL